MTWHHCKKWTCKIYSAHCKILHVKYTVLTENRVDTKQDQQSQPYVAVGPLVGPRNGGMPTWLVNYNRHGDSYVISESKMHRILVDVEFED